MSHACESTGAWFIYPEESKARQRADRGEGRLRYLPEKAGLGVELIEPDFRKLADKFPF
jgi:hypothetical protein